MLHSQLILPQEPTSKPILIFLHGLLGSGNDWQPCFSYLSDHPVLTLDLPGHGQSKSMACNGFKHCCQQINQAIHHSLWQHNLSSQHPIILIGYSLGARIAMYGMAHGLFARLSIKLTVIEAGHFGLHQQAERLQREQQDLVWAERFINNPIDEVLHDWYQQTVFSSLNHAQKQALVVKRNDNLGESVANMLLATSLAKQPYLLDKLRMLPHPIHYICGEKDTKFTQLAHKSRLNYTKIEQAGHNVHQEQPKKLADVIRSLEQQINYK